MIYIYIYLYTWYNKHRYTTPTRYSSLKLVPKNWKSTDHLIIIDSGKGDLKRTRTPTQGVRLPRDSRYKGNAVTSWIHVCIIEIWRGYMEIPNNTHFELAWYLYICIDASKTVVIFIFIEQLSNCRLSSAASPVTWCLLFFFYSINFWLCISLMNAIVFVQCNTIQRCNKVK